MGDVVAGGPLPPVQRMSVERGGVRQRLLVMRRGVVMTLIGRLLEDYVGRASLLQGANPSGLTFDPTTRLSVGS